jgi:hypothetical protein
VERVDLNTLAAKRAQPTICWPADRSTPDHRPPEKNVAVPVFSP